MLFACLMSKGYDNWARRMLATITEGLSEVAVAETFNYMSNSSTRASGGYIPTTV